MPQIIEVLAIVGSASRDSSNHKLVACMRELAGDAMQIELYDDPGMLPHFDPELTLGDVPDSVMTLRNAIERADGVLICTPEYIFSIPARLKNVLEWCVATTVFTDKPVALITASASGEKGHEALELILKTLGARFTKECSVLIQGIRGKVARDGTLTDPVVKAALEQLLQAFAQACAGSSGSGGAPSPVPA